MFICCFVLWTPARTHRTAPARAHPVVSCMHACVRAQEHAQVTASLEEQLAASRAEVSRLAGERAALRAELGKADQRFVGTSLEHAQQSDALRHALHAKHELQVGAAPLQDWTAMGWDGMEMQLVGMQKEPKKNGREKTTTTTT